MTSKKKFTFDVGYEMLFETTICVFLGDKSYHIAVQVHNDKHRLEWYNLSALWQSFHMTPSQFFLFQSFSFWPSPFFTFAWLHALIFYISRFISCYPPGLCRKSLASPGLRDERLSCLDMDKFSAVKNKLTRNVIYDKLSRQN